MNKNELLGKKYPITSVHDEILGTKTIKKVFDWENGAGYLISITSDNPEQLISIGYRKADEIVKGAFDRYMSLEK